MKAVATRSQIQLKNILFTTDFSPAAEAAIPYAAEIAKRYGARLFALHVRAPLVNPMLPPASWHSSLEAARIDTEKQRKTLLEAFPELQPEVLIQEGDIFSLLQSTVQDHNIDLIVLGTRGRSGIGKFFLGSIAEEIFRKSTCPVLTVGPHATEGPAQDGRVRKILYATDFGPETNTAAAYAVSFAQELQAHLTLMHVIAENKPGELISPHELVTFCEEHLRNLVPQDTELWSEAQYLVEQGDPAEKILQVAVEKKASLIVMGAHPERGFPGASTHLPMAIAHKVVSQATCPVLTVRA
jgi:nucleotide-binding universal stress UspA family protein